MPEDLNFLQFSDYPVRPVIHQGESLIGFVYRCYSANGYRLPSKIFTVLKIVYFNNDEDALEALEYLIKLLRMDFKQFSEQWLEVNHINKLRELNWSAWDNDQIRICPDCINDSGFYFGVWELPMMFACPKHLNGLLTACIYCGKRFRWMNLLPDWHCRCHKPIRGMKPPIAKSGMATLAQLIAQTYDAYLLNGFIAQIPKLKQDWDNPEDFYQTIHDCCYLAAILSHRKKISRRDEIFRFRISVLPLSTIGWAARLLCNPPELVVKRLTRLLRAYFRDKPKLFNAFGKGDPFFNALLYLDELANPILNDRFLQPFTLVVKKYRYFLPVNGLVIFNPSLSQKEFKRHLTQFTTWWAELSKGMAALDTRLYFNEPESELYYPVRFQTNKEIDVYQILEVLANASYNNVPVENFQALVHWWHIPDELRKLKPSSQVLYQLGEYLKSIPASELAFVHDLVLNGRGKAT